jgi:hypothetical protein
LDTNSSLRKLHEERRDLQRGFARHNRQKRCECVNCTRYREVEKMIAIKKMTKLDE